MDKTIVATIGLLAVAASSMADPGKNVLGYLGKANQKTRIYAGPNSHSHCYSRVKDNQYLVVQPYSETWDKVLLTSYTYGYVKLNTVTRLPYEVSYPKAGVRGTNIPMEQGDLTSRGGVARYALSYIGQISYKYGGTDPATGMDCSAFVRQMYGKINVNLPRTAAEQAMVGQPIYRLEELRPGDRLYFWEAKRGKIGHTGIYEGGGFFIHNSHGKGGVATSYLSPSWQRLLVAARR